MILVLVHSYLQFKKCETSSSSCSSVILIRRALNDWPQSVDWSRSNTGGFCESCCSSSVLSGWLVEVDSNSSLPVLVEVVVRDLVIVLDGLRIEISYVCQWMSILPTILTALKTQ